MEVRARGVRHAARTRAAYAPSRGSRAKTCAHRHVVSSRQERRFVHGAAPAVVAVPPTRRVHTIERHPWSRRTQRRRFIGSDAEKSKRRKRRHERASARARHPAPRVLSYTVLPDGVMNEARRDGRLSKCCALLRLAPSAASSRSRVSSAQPSPAGGTGTRRRSSMQHRVAAACGTSPCVPGVLTLQAQRTQANTVELLRRARAAQARAQRVVAFPSGLQCLPGGAGPPATGA